MRKIWGSLYYYIRIIQGTVRYELLMKQASTHVQHKANTCRTWGIDCSNHNRDNIGFSLYAISLQVILVIYFRWKLGSDRWLSLLGGGKLCYY